MLESSLAGLNETLNQLVQDNEDQVAYLNSYINEQLVDDTNQSSNYYFKIIAHKIDYKETRSSKKNHQDQEIKRGEDVISFVYFNWLLSY